MAKVLVHLATGPENATRVALALLIARTAADDGHDVRLFLAGDAVHLARPETAGALVGVGTGAASEHWDALERSGVQIFLSRMSSDARGIDASTREGTELARPSQLVELAVWADTVLTY